MNEAEAEAEAVVNGLAGEEFRCGCGKIWELTPREVGGDLFIRCHCGTIHFLYVRPRASHIPTQPTSV